MADWRSWSGLRSRSAVAVRIASEDVVDFRAALAV